MELSDLYSINIQYKWNTYVLTQGFHESMDNIYTKLELVSAKATKSPRN